MPTDYEKILTQSPWLLEKEAIKRDVHIQKLNEMQVVFRFNDFLEYRFEDGVYIVTGLRQIGKTTLLKMFVRENITKYPHSNFLYFNCDLLDSRQDIFEIVRTYLSKIAEKNSRIFIMLDEITSVRDGFIAVKALVDSGNKKKITYILAGSSTINVKRTGEYLPGRRGKGIDFVMFPVTFEQYLKTRYPKIDFSISIETIDRDKMRISGKIDLQKELDLYLVHGGIPMVINDCIKNGTIGEEIFETYRSWISSETAKAEKKEHIVKGILQRSINTLSSDTSYNAFVQELNIGSHNTIYDYVDFLERSFILFQVFHYDINSKKINYRKNKKFYFVDPFVYALCDKWLGAKQLQDFSFLNNSILKSRLIENLVYLKLKGHFNDVYYFSNSFEIDFVINTLLIEVKYQNKIVSDDYKGLVKKKGKRILVSKNDLSVSSEISIIPIELFLLLSNKYFSAP
ncbi:MAG: ATP-binding protein [bacterium]